MASACVNNNIDVSPEKFPSYGWLSPRMSLSREDDPSKKPSSSADEPSEGPDPVDFEFCLEDPVAMLPADELFSEGKLVPLHLSRVRPSSLAIKSPDETNKSCNISSFDPYVFSPKAPRCSSRWRELLGLKKLYQNSTNSKTEHSKTMSSSTTHTKSSLKHLLQRNSKSPSSSSCSVSSSLDGSSLNLPLLKDPDCESVSLSSSRLSLSSSSSGHEHDDLPRLSLDSDKPSPSPNPFANPPRMMRLVKPRECSHNQTATAAATARAGRSPIRRESAAASSTGVSVDSPRLNSSGKIVFQSLERSSSSPSSFNVGPRYKHRGMERSYSANVPRVNPVLNVPVCSLRGSSKSGSVFGFGQLFSSSQKNPNGAATIRQQSNNCRNRTDRI